MDIETVLIPRSSNLIAQKFFFLTFPPQRLRGAENVEVNVIVALSAHPMQHLSQPLRIQDPPYSHPLG